MPTESAQSIDQVLASFVEEATGTPTLGPPVNTREAGLDRAILTVYLHRAPGAKQSPLRTGVKRAVLRIVSARFPYQNMAAFRAAK